MMLIYWKYYIDKLSQLRMIHKNVYWLLQFMIQQIYLFGRWNLPPGVNLHFLQPQQTVTQMNHKRLHKQ